MYLCMFNVFRKQCWVVLFLNGQFLKGLIDACKTVIFITIFGPLSGPAVLYINYMGLFELYYYILIAIHKRLNPHMWFMYLSTGIAYIVCKDKRRIVLLILTAKNASAILAIALTVWIKWSVVIVVPESFKLESTSIKCGFKFYVETLFGNYSDCGQTRKQPNVKKKSSAICC